LTEVADKPIAAKLLPYTTFYEAEDYHKDLYIKAPIATNRYTDFSVRKEFKEFVWGEIQKFELL